jgi:acyl-ACP thioesterase
MPDSRGNQDLILSRNFHVRSNETDISGKLRPGALLNYLIQAAIDSADQLGFGLADLRENQVFWALSRITLLMNRAVRWRENIKVETWPKDISGLHVLRDFRILDEQNKEIGKAVSGWLMIDTARKRPQKVERSEVFTKMRDLHAADPSLLERLAEPRESFDDEIQVESTYFDFDLNGHVTATRYVDWMMDMVPFDFQRNRYVSKMAINFVKEILPGDGVVLHKWNQRDAHFFSGSSVEHRKVSFLANVAFDH